MHRLTARFHVCAKAAQLVVLPEPLVFLQPIKHVADTYLQLGVLDCLRIMLVV